MNQQRRVFRGRGGPTDRNLPKHNARRRRQQPPATAVQRPPSRDDPNRVQDDEPTTTSSTVETAAVAVHHPQEQQNNEGVGIEGGRRNFDNGDHICEVLSPTLDANKNDQEEPIQVAEKDDNNEATNDDKGEQQDRRIQHLKQRIRNNGETMQNSKSLVVPSNYRKLVLDAVKNTVKEWGAIVRQLSSEESTPSTAREKEDVDDNQQPKHDCTSSTTTTTTGLAVFELVQQALQCGPLAGSKAGYVKRCGTEVATMVFDFLNAIIGTSSSVANHTTPDSTTKVGGEGEGDVVDDNNRLMEKYCWTNKQASTFSTWKENAKKAIEKGKPASKSLLKKQQQQQVSKRNNTKNK